jgi:hypothetical protein
MLKHLGERYEKEKIIDGGRGSVSLMAAGDLFT